MTKEGLIRLLSSRGSGNHADLREAIELADTRLRGRNRCSGEPAVEHSYEVAAMLLQICQCDEIVIAGVLHDLPEDTGLLISAIGERFGPTVAFLVDGLTHEPDFGESDWEEQSFWYCFKLWYYARADPRILLIKLFDRLHYFRTRRAMSKNSRQRHAQETIDVLLPMAGWICGSMYGGLEPVRSWVEELQRLAGDDYQDESGSLAAFFSRPELKTISRMPRLGKAGDG
ncbi:MAG: HD domain-containing protein [Patescibacteria group bacterium]|nr:HD domain-containing protein [Patescibacteria group bacterium]